MKSEYHIKKFYTGSRIIKNVCVNTIDNKIDNWNKESFDINKSFEYMIPSFIDLQIYGAKNSLLMVEPKEETIKKIYDHNVHSGTFFFQPTIASESKYTILKSIEAVKSYISNGGKGCLGLHIEGPWINPNRKGAHSLKYINSPIEKDVKEIIDRAEGSISMITLAPEVVEEKIIGLILNNDIVISIGHSELSYKNTIEYINKGVNVATHLFNAMPSIHHRDKNLTLAILENHKIFSSIICDGFHVDFSLIRLAHKIKKDSLFCITDAVTNSNDKQHNHKFNGKFYENNGILSGSSVTMHQSFKNLINKVGLSFNEALKMCCITPSKVFKNKNLLPIETNSENSFNILDKNLNLIK
tara:strand:+ start:56 stop:1123 length:1068 start_codon:yes stop_codon:yes gene_type:complete